jgi:OOP family OmpA-OmpF porin
VVQQVKALAHLKWKTTYGIGVSYNVSKTVAVRGEFERFLKLGDANTTGEGDVNLLSVGVVAKF